jgi:aminoglycoside phosphotransferase (APT) family kinase protein
MAVDHGVLHAQLERWAGTHHHEGVTIADLRAMPGHAGLSFGFTVLDRGAVVERLVLRMPPAGVRRRGNTDVLRQVPLLRALRRSGVAVPEVRWFDDDEQWFGVPYFMAEFLPGDTYQVREPAPMFDGVSCAEVLRVAVEALASVHRVDHHLELADWESPRELADEIEFWTPILAKAAEPEWRAMGERARVALLDALPNDPLVGVFHGDFQTNNVLFEVNRPGTPVAGRPSPRVIAVLDWEISGVGAQLLDIGWLLFMNDATSWADGAGLLGVPAFDDIVAWYSAALGRRVSLDDVAFYRALAGYRFGVISGLNVMLHRTGKRHDPEWERIALSVPAMFDRACELVS